MAVRRPIEVSANNLKDQVVSIQRVTKVVKGGKNLSFSALVVVGDQRGHAGFGMGKAREVPMAIRKAIEQAKKNLIQPQPEGHFDSASGDWVSTVRGKCCSSPLRKAPESLPEVRCAR